MFYYDYDIHVCTRHGVKYIEMYLNTNTNTFEKYFKYFFKYFSFSGYITI